MDTLETTRTILVVEGNVLMRKLFVRCLEDGGFSVIEAEDPSEVVGLMRDVRPDLVLMDLIMPTLSGMDLIRKIRTDPELADARVVAVGNLATPGDRRRIADAGFDGHLPKPIRPREFPAQVGAYLTGAPAVSQ